MNINGFVAVILLVLVVAVESDAGLLVKFQRTVESGVDAKANVTQISPSPGPIPETGSGRIKANSNISAPNNSTSSPRDSTEVDPRDLGFNQEGIHEKCGAYSIRCTDQKNMIACLILLPHPENKQTGRKEYFLLVQNDGDSNLEVNIVAPASSVHMDLKELQIPKHQAKKINVSVNVEVPSTIILRTGSGECALQTGVSVSQRNFFPTFPRIPSYTDVLSPIYGGYFLFVVALIVGGSWACCKFGKRGQQHGSGVQYQELEMGSGPAVNVETADGWDEGWDDDWDEEKAVKSPGSTGNLSANGLTSRLRRDEWGNDWDD